MKLIFVLLRPIISPILQTTHLFTGMITRFGSGFTLLIVLAALLIFYCFYRPEMKDEDDSKTSSPFAPEAGNESNSELPDTNSPAAAGEPPPEE